MRMRTAAALFVAFSLTAPAAAAADTPATVPQLVPGEVLLEVDGLGIVHTPASSATITANLNCTGTSRDDALRNLDAEIARVTAAARAAGAAPNDIVVRSRRAAELRLPFDGVEPTLPGGGEAAATSSYTAQATIVIRLRDVNRAAALAETAGASDPVQMFAGFGNNPMYEHADDRAARREARQRAISSARADAEAYADAVGMRIVRMIRITERAGFDFVGMLATEREAESRFGWLRAPRGEAQVETRAVVGVDFVLGPR